MTSDDLKKTAKDTVGRAADAAAQAKGAAADAAATASDHADTIASQGAAAAQNLYGRAKETASGLGDRLPESANDAIDAGRRAYAQGGEQLARQIAKQPIEALLLAGAIGYLVGWAANRT